MERKMLVLDIDGTLTNSKKEITSKTKEAIIKLQKNGHIVVIASGRPTAGIIDIADELELEVYGGFVLSYNGAKITSWRTNEVVYQQVLPAKYIRILYDFAKENNVGLVTYEDECVVTGTRHDKYMEHEAKINGIRIKDVAPFPDYVNFNVNKCLMTAEPEKALEVENKLNEMYGNELSIYRSEPFFVEIMPQNVDKAATLDVLVNMLGLNKENTICCGDGFNDLSMIKYAGIGVAMENAQEIVKESADYVTKSNDDDGIVHVIEKFIFNEKKAV